MKKILVIDDNEGVRENLCEILELAGYAAIPAADGKTGVEKALSMSPDMILCDIMMPGLDGYGVLHILSSRPETAAIPFIFLTAKTEKSDIRYGMGMGADDYITKPFEETDLLKTIDSRLKRAEMRRETARAAGENLGGSSSATQSGEVPAFHTRHYGKKDLIYHEGDKPSYVYRLDKGSVRLYCFNAEGKEYTTEIISPGSYFGYVSAINGKPREESAEALDECDVSLADGDQFVKYLMSDHELMMTFIKMLSNNVADKEKELLHLAYDTVRRRVAQALLKLQERAGSLETRYGIPVSRELLSSMAGTSTESAIRVLSGLKNEGLIEISGSNIKLVDTEGLRMLKF